MSTINATNEHKTNGYRQSLYHAVHTGNTGDVAFYKAACENSSSVLELGCGTGRIASELITPKREVVGLDCDAEALAVAVSRGIQVHHGNMCQFDLGTKFERIIVPYNGLYCLLSEEAVIDCLLCVKRHLTDQGEVIFDGYAGDALAQNIANQTPQSPDLVGQIFADDQYWTVYECAEWNPLTQRIDATYTHEPHAGGTSEKGIIKQRYLHSYDLADLFEASDLMMLSLHGGFADQPFDADSDLMVVRATHW